MSNETKELLEETIAKEETALTEAAEEQEDALTEAPEDGEEVAEDEADEEEDEEELDEDEEEEVVHAYTQIDGPVLDMIAHVMVEETPKKLRTTYLVLGLLALPAAAACIAGNHSIIGFLLVVVGLMLLQSWYATNEKTMRKQLRKSEGLHWDYTVDKLGVHVGKTVNDRCIGWNTIKRGWLEGDFYLMAVQGSVVVIRRSSLSESDRNLLELLMLEHLKDCKL